jgi:hypothetical protein
MKLKRKTRIIIGVAVGLAICVLCSVAAVVASYRKGLSFRFLDGYEPERQSKVITDRGTYEILQYHFKADYDTFALAAKSELLSKGYQDITDPNEYDYGQDYERRAFDRTRVEIDYAVVRIHITITRDKPKFTIKGYWRYVKYKLSRQKA